MNSESNRQQALDLIREACDSGARRSRACKELGITLRTVQRWERDGLVDRRKGSRATPANKLKESEKDQIIKVLNSKEFCDLNPNQVVPLLADKGIYMASESTMYRILREKEMNKHREPSRPASKKRPQEHVATSSNQIWSWDISYLPSQIKGLHFYLYMIMDVYSRKVVAWQVHGCESSELAADLMTEACFRENISRDQIVLHSDNGAPMKGATMLAKLQELGVMPSFSRPSVSDDNPFSESLFRTLKYRPEYPENPFASLSDARDWTEHFVDWYNNNHLHSGIRFVTPSDRHSGRDRQILAKRHQVYLKAKNKHPERWSGKTRDWSHILEVALNKAKSTDESVAVVMAKAA